MAGFRRAGAAGARGFPGLAGPRKPQADSYDAVTSYNNYYEFGTDKEDPRPNAHTLKPRPWSIAVEGEVKTPANYASTISSRG